MVVEKQHFPGRLCNTVTMAQVASVHPSGTAFVSFFFGRGISRFRTMSSIRNNNTTSMSAVKKRKADVKLFRLAPSDFAFLWEECQRCFYLKAHKKLYRPRAPFPSIFGAIDVAMKMHLRGLPTHELLPEMPKGVFLCEKEDAWVECKPITPPGHDTSVYIRGMVDCLVKHEDGTFGVIDFKTSSVSKTSQIYARQLHAYAMAIENPSAKSELVQGRVTDMGLVVYSPSHFNTPQCPGGNFSAALTGDLSYVHIPRDDAAFLQFIGNIVDVLCLPEPPRPPPKKNGSWSGSFTSCPYCQFLHDAGHLDIIP